MDLHAEYTEYVTSTNCDPYDGTCDCVDSYTEWLTWQEPAEPPMNPPGR